MKHIPVTIRRVSRLRRASADDPRTTYIIAAASPSDAASVPACQCPDVLRTTSTDSLTDENLLSAARIARDFLTRDAADGRYVTPQQLRQALADHHPSRAEVEAVLTGVIASHTHSYNSLTDLPSINGVQLKGNMQIASGGTVSKDTCWVEA